MDYNPIPTKDCITKMQKEEYLIKNACYSLTKYYLCKQNNKRSLLGRKQRSQVVRSFPNRYLFSYTNKVTSLFSISCILRIILACKTYAFRMQNNRFCNALITNELSNSYSCKKCLHAYRIIFAHKISFLTKTSIVLLQAYNKDKLIICTDNTTSKKSLKTTIALCFYQSMHAKRNRFPPANGK